MMKYIQIGSKQFFKASIALFFGGFVTFSILYTTQPLLPIFSNEFSVSPSITSLSVSLSTGFLSIMMLFAASLSDRFGKKQIMNISMFFTSAISIIIAFVPNFESLLIFRAILGITAAGIPSLAMAYVAEEFHPNTIGTAMGIYISGTTIGGLAGRISAGILTDLFTWRIALFIIGMIALILSVGFSLLMPKPKRVVKTSINFKTAFQTYQVHLSNKPLMALIILGFLFMGGFVTLFNYIGFLFVSPPYSYRQSVIGLIFLVYLFGSFSSLYMGKKASIYGYAKVLTVNVLITMTGAILTLFSSIWLIIIGLSIFTFGFFACHSVTSSWIGEFSKVYKAQSSSLYLLFYYLGSSIAGTLGGILWSNFGWIGVTLFVQVLFIISLPFILYSQRSFMQKARTNSGFKS
jgi:MFS transporter, YNFM family, putative membrane transport protein